MLLARMIHFFHPLKSVFRIRASLLALSFIILDFVSFVIQIVGGSYAGPTAPQDQQMRGVHIYMGGIGLQQFFIFVFLGLVGKFHLEMRALSVVGGAKEGWKGLMWTFYASLGFITVGLPESLICKSHHTS